jgi:hypothetical protein
MGDYQYRTDPVKNRLYIRLSGFFKERDVPPMLEELEQVLDDLRPGFDVVTDLSHFKPGSPAAASFIRKGAEMIKARGRRNAVRITGTILTGVMQFKRVIEGVFSEDSVRYAKTLEEAEHILDRMEHEVEAGVM